MPLTLECAGAAVLSSAYFVGFLSRTDIPIGDLPPSFDARIASGISTLDIGISGWHISNTQPLPANGVWSPTVTYATGNTVSSANYSIRTSAGVLLAPLTYRSLQPGNLGHDPDDYEGWWTCISMPPHNLVQNKNFVPCSFGYALNPLPTKTTLAATTWTATFWHSLFWLVTQPGDIVQLMDIYVKLNYLVGGSIIPVVSRPLTSARTADTPWGRLLNPGINAQFQTWSNSTVPTLTLSNFEAKVVDGFEAAGIAGEPYLSLIVASGGTAPYAYAIVGGSLPEGVTLNGQTGVISGTPTVSGVFTFTAQVTDATGATAQVTCAASIDCGGGVGNAFY